MQSDKPLVNSWTEFGQLEVCVVGAVHDEECHTEPEPNFRFAFCHTPRLNEYMNYPIGPRAKDRVKKA
jgi:hypothetical protein